MALTSILPLPKNPLLRDRVTAPVAPTSLTETSFEPPPYGKRDRWNPRSVEDFGDGGAFPECHILQYPLGMGREDGNQGIMIPLKVDAEGNVKFDSIVKQGQKGRAVHATAKDQLGLQEVAENDVGMIQESARDELDNMQKPDEEELKKIAEKTRAALATIVDQKQAATQPTHIPKQNLNDPVFIRYTPNAQQGEQYNSGSRQRIIRLQEMPVDPLDPPKFQHKKLPAAPGSPPAPVMHSPPRKITVQDQQNWKIPPAISNWKNIKGYTLPLDKRLAADGRTMQEVQINDKFAKLSEALFVAERTARAEIEKRAKVAQAIQKKKKNETEELLEKLARQARSAHDKISSRDQEGYDEVDKEDDEPENEEEAKARGEREELRRERRREMKREFRQEQRKQEKAAKAGKKKAALSRSDRDISEKIALGESVGKSSQSLFDQRLFNQSEGMDQGFGAEDAYDVYSKPLFARGAQSGVYRPKPVPLEESGDDAVKEILEKSTSRFKPDRGFEGTEGGETKAAPRDKPVAFERDEADPFGIGRMLTAAKQGGRHTLDKIGSQGHMSATGGSSQSADKYRESGSRRRDRIGFEEGDSSGKKKSRTK